MRWSWRKRSLPQDCDCRLEVCAIRGICIAWHWSVATWEVLLLYNDAFNLPQMFATRSDCPTALLRLPFTSLVKHRWRLKSGHNEHIRGTPYPIELQPEHDKPSITTSAHLSWHQIQHSTHAEIHKHQSSRQAKLNADSHDGFLRTQNPGKLWTASCKLPTVTAVSPQANLPVLRKRVMVNAARLSTMQIEHIYKDMTKQLLQLAQTVYWNSSGTTCPKNPLQNFHENPGSRKVNQPNFFMPDGDYNIEYCHTLRTDSKICWHWLGWLAQVQLMSALSAH